ncbi:ATP-binding protein [Spirosoma gilvum]
MNGHALLGRHPLNGNRIDYFLVKFLSGTLYIRLIGYVLVKHLGIRTTHLSISCCLVSFLFFLNAEAQIPRNQLPIPQSAKPVDLHVQYVVDTTNRLTISQMEGSGVRWKTASDPTLILGFTTHPVWCRFVLQPSVNVSQSYALELTNFYVDRLTLYQPDSLTGWRTMQSGDLIPFAQRTPQTRYPAVYISVSGTTPQLVYARIQSSQHHSYQWRAWNRAAFDTYRLPDVDRYIIFTLAILLALFQIALLLFMYQYVVLRSYALFALAVCLSVLFASGFSGIFFPQSPYWVHTSHYATVGLLLPTLAYYVVQSYQLKQYWPRLIGLYTGFGAVGVMYAGLSFFIRHPYITWALIATLAVMTGFTLALLLVLYWRGVRPAIWNVLALVVTLPVYTYFYGRNAGFFTGSMSEETLKFLMLLCFASEPFFVVLMLWQATRERIQTAQTLTSEQAKRESIQALDQLKTDFFTNVSHELRTPLTLLVGPLQTLRNRYPDNELYALMYRNASRLQMLISQLLDLAKLDARQMKNLPAVGNLAVDVASWVSMFVSLAQSRSITLTVHQNQSDWPALYDADKVEKILANLLSNALKYTPAGGTVRVEGQYVPTGVTIEVSDTGSGMTPEVLSHVFDRFYQGPATNQTEVGTGVGLALTNELVQLLEGSITVQSQPGEGSVFRVWLPIQARDERVLPGRNDHDSAEGSQQVVDMMAEGEKLAVDEVLSIDVLDAESEKPVLLLVDDSDDLRAYIRMILASQFTLLEASDGQHGLDMARQTLPDLILTDLMMPRLDGLELCRSLRADPRTDHIPLVMLTAKASIENRLIGLETGADDYLTKPFLPAELLVRLANLRRRQLAQQLYWQRTLAGSVVEGNLVDLSVSTTSPQPHPETPPFLKQLYAVLEHHLDQPDFEVEQLADALAMSGRSLNRKLKVLLGLNTREIIRSYRLRRGNEMLDQGIQPTQVAYAVGFGSLSSFGRAYKDQYGYAPSARKSNA